MVLWLIVLVQTVVTRLYVSRTAFTQAFARNQIAVEKDSQAAADRRNTEEGNQCQEGTVPGRLSIESMQELARDMFRQMGGVEVMSSSESGEDNYFVAYGYTRGLEAKRKSTAKTLTSMWRCPTTKNKTLPGLLWERR